VKGNSIIFQEETSKTNLGILRRNVNTWLKDHNIKAFYSVTQDQSFSVGAKNCMNLVGLGKIKIVYFVNVLQYGLKYLH
jgi:hypothetical protein